jgi:hypothetical protein
VKLNHGGHSLRLPLPYAYKWRLSEEVDDYRFGLFRDNLRKIGALHDQEFRWWLSTEDTTVDSFRVCGVLFEDPPSTCLHA